MKKMTKKEFVTYRGLECPNCRSTNLDFDPVSFDSSSVDRLYRNVECRKCLSTWTEVYTLTEYDGLKKGD